MIEAYPLTWPDGHPRTARPAEARFKTTLAKARDGVIAELKRLCGWQSEKSIIISTNIPLRQDGLPRGDWEKRLITDRGVAVYFTYDGEPRVFCCDAWNQIEDNMHAIKLSIESIRGLERWGVSQMLKRIFTGFEALPEPPKKWWQVLQVPETAPYDQVKASYRNLILLHHPDKGGDSHQFGKIITAMEDYMKTQKA